MKTRIPLTQAEALANKIVNAPTPGCGKIAIAGSIRRQRPTVGDIEIVAIPWLAEIEASMYDFDTKNCLFFGKNCISQEHVSVKCIAKSFHFSRLRSENRRI